MLHDPRLYPTVDWLLRALAAQFMVAGIAYVAYAAAERLIPTPRIALRWTSTCVVGMWLSTVGFHALLAVRAFTLPVAAGLVGVAVAATYFVGRPRGGTVRRMLNDLARFGRAIRPDRNRPFESSLDLAFSAAFVLVGVRALLVPVVSWDSLTYHAVKAAMWVQTGGPIEFTAPGGWSIYRHYLGGGELLQAWAMLPMRSDLLAGCVDVVQWGFLGVAACALGRELDLPRRASWIGAAYFMTLPAVARAVGSLYVDNAVALALLATCVLALHSVRRRDPRAVPVCMMALGVATGVKIFALPVAALLVLVLVAPLVLRSRRRRGGAWLVAGLLAALLAAAPWFVRNWQRTGYPLAPFPVALAGVELGRANDALLWYMDRPQLRDAGWNDELRSLTQVFGIPGSVPLTEPSLGALTVVPVVLFGFGFPSLYRRVRRRALLLLVFIAPLVVSFFGPGMRTTRLIWAPTSARYLLAALAVMIVASCAIFRQGLPSRLYRRFLLVGILAHLLLSVVSDWIAPDAIAAAAGAGLLLVLGWVSRKLWNAARRPAVALAGLIVLSLPAMGLLQTYRDATRDSALHDRVVLHQVLRYWVPAALRVDDVERPRTLAVTAGASQENDNWFLYPFLGRRLQNRLVYAPVTLDGRVIDLARGAERRAAADFGAWYTRLGQIGAEEVMSFSPTSMELDWMERRPDLFARLAGDGVHWGLYRRTGGDSSLQPSVHERSGLEEPSSNRSTHPSGEWPGARRVDRRRSRRSPVQSSGTQIRSQSASAALLVGRPSSG